MSRDKERAAMIYLDESRVLTWRSRLPIDDHVESAREQEGKGSA
jgi:hypothetical protein